MAESTDNTQYFPRGLEPQSRRQMHQLQAATELSGHPQVRAWRHFILRLTEPHCSIVIRNRKHQHLWNKLLELLESLQFRVQR